MDKEKKAYYIELLTSAAAINGANIQNTLNYEYENLGNISLKEVHLMVRYYVSLSNTWGQI